MFVNDRALLPNFFDWKWTRNRTSCLGVHNVLQWKNIYTRCQSKYRCAPHPSFVGNNLNIHLPYPSGIIVSNRGLLARLMTETHFAALLDLYGVAEKSMAYSILFHVLFKASFELLRWVSLLTDASMKTIAMHLRLGDREFEGAPSSVNITKMDALLSCLERVEKSKLSDHDAREYRWLVLSDSYASRLYLVNRRPDRIVNITWKSEHSDSMTTYAEWWAHSTSDTVLFDNASGYSRTSLFSSLAMRHANDTYIVNVINPNTCTPYTSRDVSVFEKTGAGI